MKTLALVACLMLAACPAPSPTPPPPPPPAADGAPAPPPPADASSPTCLQACAAIAAASCPMGADPSCPALMQTLSDQGKQPNPANGNHPLTCADVLTVKTKADAVKLGFVCQ